jgi:hypothetical protein
MPFASFLFATLPLAIAAQAPSSAPTVVARGTFVLGPGQTQSTLEVRMVTGRRFVDNELWCGGQGLEKYEGSFDLAVRIEGKPPVLTNLTALVHGELWFSAAPWSVQFADYNHDGRLDFNLGQHGGCAGWVYWLFEISDKGSVTLLRLPEPNNMFWSIDRANSTQRLYPTSEGFRVSRPGVSASDFVCTTYRWLGRDRKFEVANTLSDFCPEDNPDR